MSSLNISELSQNEIFKHVKNSPLLIIPIASLEPIGDNLPLGITAQIADKIASEVSHSLNVLRAPLLNYAYVTPFKAFCGVVGMRWNSFATTISDLVRSASIWGVKNIIFIDGGVLNGKYIDEGINRYRKMLPNDFRYTVINWQNIPEVRKSVSSIYTGLKEIYRSDAAVIKLHSELNGRDIEDSLKTELPNKNLFKNWRKRGMDPEQLKKLSPTPLFSRWESVDNSIDLLPVVINSVTSNCKKFIER